MRCFHVIAFLLAIAPACGQTALETIDSLLVNAAYEELLIRVDQLRPGTENESIRLQNKKAEALIHLGKFIEAEAILRRLEKTGEPFLRAITQTNLGALFMHRGRNDLAIDILREAQQGFTALGKNTSLEAANAITLLGLVYKFTGKHTQAEEQMQMALALRQELLGGEDERIAASFNNLGLVYTNIDNDKALDYYEKASAIYQRRYGAGHPKTAIALTNIGFIYSLLELYGDALNHYEDALKILERVYAGPHQSKAFVLFNMGNVYRQIANTTSARGYYERALDAYHQVYGEKHPEIAGVHNALGNVALDEGKFDMALAHFQEALKANVPDFASDDIHANPGLETFYHGNVLLYSMMYKAQALEERHFGETLKFSDLELALATLQQCDALIDRLRHQSTNESDKLALGAIATEVYEDGVRIAHEAALTAWKKQPFRELAFYFAAKSKSAVLLEAISDSDAKAFAGIPPALLDEEKTLKAAIALTSQKLAQKPAADKERYLREALFELNRRYDAFTRKLEADFPSYFNLKYNVASPTVAALQGLINGGSTALLSYFLDEKMGRLYTFVITAEDFRILDHSVGPDFDRFITGMRNGLYYGSIQTYVRSANFLSKLLIPKLPKDIKHLVILPAGRLSIIPFETLFTAQVDEDASFASLPYLLRRYSVRYEFSAAVLKQKSREEDAAAESILLCAPVNFPGKLLPPLPGTESEVTDISNLFASKSINHELFIGEHANEHVIKTSALKDYDVLHFATHGVVDELHPALSRIFLHGHSGAEDGNLYTGEIYNLELDARLVTLSACKTGLGKISKGEGVIGLSRALVYAGANSIVVSFWSVADESTAMLMKSFYREALEHSPAGYHENLRQAKLSLMKDPRYAPPYYWAAFILIGY